VKVISPLLGFNNNVKHKGRVFHIQTEDSGIKHPHVITHLFADGGRILKTTKTSYAEHLSEANMQQVVHQLMKEQHKAMFIALRDGQFDHLFEENAAPHAAAPAASPTAPTAPTAPAAPAAVAPVAAAAPAPVAQPEPPPPPPPPPPPSTRASPAVAASIAARPAKPKVEPAVMPAVASARPTAPDPHTAPQGEGLKIDLDALERASAEAEAPFQQNIQDMPPPPAAVLSSRKPGAKFTANVYQSLGGPDSSTAQFGAPSSAGRYAPSRPAAIFASARPTEGTSIFGEDLISEKSLDEVILSYLAEDLDGTESP
jgi:hypothetical protein